MSDCTLATQSTRHSLPTTRQAFFCLALLACLCGAMGWAATQWNDRFYSLNQPFYDSLAYNAQLHRVMTIGKEDGLLAAVRNACTTGTVCLPFLFAALASPFCEASRHVGIWIQTFELFCLCWALWAYMTRVQRASPIASVLATFPFLLVNCLYGDNGGLSDFRMDLSLMLLFGTTCIWYLTASRSSDYWPYLLLGISCGATCLFRATAPVYFVATLGPIVLWDLVFLRRDRQHWIGLAIATGVACVTSLWFYVLNFNTLYYYYFIWNTDANAKLPIRESMDHIKFVTQHIGPMALVYMVAFQLAVAWSKAKDAGYSVSTLASQFKDVFLSLNLRALFLGIVPVGLLVVRGAGKNPFVCMPSVIGLCLFALFPVALRRGLRFTPVMACALSVIGALCVYQASNHAWEKHAGFNPLSMNAHKVTLDSMIEDAKVRHCKEIHFGTAHCHYLNGMSLENVAILDRDDSTTKKDGVQVQGIMLKPSSVMGQAAEADWDRVEGGSDDEKLEWLVNRAAKDLDYLILPNEASSVQLRDHVAHNVINRFAVSLRSALLETAVWEPVSDEIKNGEGEIVRIYRNRNRLPDADATVAKTPFPGDGIIAR